MLSIMAVTFVTLSRIETRITTNYVDDQRAEMLVQVLCEDLGVKYDLSAKDNFSFADSRVAFIHGMIPMAGQTLAELLDIRTNPTGEPTADNLPATINPLEFLLSNLMRNNLFVIRVRPDSFAANAPGLQMFSLLRNIMPPHVSYVALIDLAPDTDTMDLSDVDSVVEDVGKFKGAAVLEEAVMSSSSRPSASAYSHASSSVAKVRSPAPLLSRLPPC
jgi:hypothetical protein